MTEYLIIRENIKKIIDLNKKFEDIAKQKSEKIQITKNEEEIPFDPEWEVLNMEKDMQISINNRLKEEKIGLEKKLNRNMGKIARIKNSIIDLEKNYQEKRRIMDENHEKELREEEISFKKAESTIKSMILRYREKQNSLIQEREQLKAELNRGGKKKNQ